MAHKEEVVTWVADTPLEQEFLDVVAKHGKDIKEKYEELVKLSEEYGIPFGTYRPAAILYGGKFYELSEQFMEGVTGADLGWESSSANC